MATAGSTRAFGALAFGGYLLAAVVVTFPLVRELGAAAPGSPGDTGFFLWCMDTFWSELGAGSSPFATRRILVPLGANLAGSNCVPLLAVLAWPFLDALPLYLGLVTLLVVALAGLGMLRLVETLGGDRAAAAVAGLAYAINPAFLSLIEHAHVPTVAAAALLPFGVRALVCFVWTAGWRPLLVLSGVLWAIVLTHVYPAAAFLIIAAVMAGVAAPGRVTVAHVRRAVVVGAMNVALAAGFVTAVLPADVRGELPRGGEAFTSSAVVDLADTLVPSARHPVLGALHARWASDRNADIESYFVGWGLLALAGVGLAAGPRRREACALAVAGLVTLVVAAGTTLRVSGVVLLEGAATPFHWVARLPLFELLDSPRRLIVGVELVVAALAGVGLAALLRRTGHRAVVVAGALALVALEFGQLGGSTTTMRVPAVYERLAARPDARTVLEIGGGLAASNMYLGLDWSAPAADYAYWQTVHRKPRVGGYLSRIPGRAFAWFQGEPVIGGLLDMADPRRGRWPGTAYTAAEVARFVDAFDLGYVIIPPSRRRDEYAAVVEPLLHAHVATVERIEGWTLYVLARR